MSIFMSVKKVIKHRSELFNRVVTLTVSDELTKLEGKILAPRKLAEANEALRNLKTPLPK